MVTSRTSVTKWFRLSLVPFARVAEALEATLKYFFHLVTELLLPEVANEGLEVLEVTKRLNL